MTEHHLDIATLDGAMNSFVVHPAGAGPFPVVLFFMDAPGKREELHAMARRLARKGYFVVLPNLYYRRSRDYWLKERTEPAMAEMYSHMRALNAVTSRCDTQAMLEYVGQQPQADASRVGAVGYCMSGPFVVWAAADFPDRIQGIASVHGANMATDKPESPHRVASRIRCESYFAFAEMDKLAPPADVAKVQAGLDASGAPYRIEWYPGADHGFVFPLRPAYNLVAAERHWERLTEFFARTLRVNG